MQTMPDVAIVGAAVALPGVSDLDQMRADMSAGTIHLVPVDDSQARAEGLNDRVLGNSNYVAVAAALPDADVFDREMFAMTQAEALWTDPQQRLLLRLTHEALESAAAQPRTEQIGMWATTSTSTYLWGRVDDSDMTSPAEVDYRALLGNDRDFVATRIAYKLGLTGPTMSVHSACSSSLVALHQAVIALAVGDAEVAVVGAASLRYPQHGGYVYQAGGIVSPTGQSRPFDSASNGTVQGSGGGVVVLRTLADAQTRGDAILAVIAGSAVNNDGSQRMGYSAPSPVGQQAAIEQALLRSGASAADIGYVETHGTGTPIGDPIEFRALQRVYGKIAKRETPCYLGAVKANFGHLDVAAGIVGLLKTVLVVSGQTIFPQPSFESSSTSIALEDNGFDISTAIQSIPQLEYAALSSFGMGGTNAHVIVRRAADRAPSVNAPPAAVTIELSARTANGLLQYRHRVAEYLRDHSDIGIVDVANTVATRWRHDAKWRATVDSVAALIAQLEDDNSTHESRTSVDVEPEPGISNNQAVQRVWLPPSPPTGESYLLPVKTAAPRDDADRASVRTDVAALFHELVAEEMGDNLTGPDTDFFEAGGDSVALVSIAGKLSDAVGFRVDFDELDAVTEVGSMAAILATQAASAHRAVSTAGKIHPLLTFGPAEPDIYLYPPAGGTNFCYRTLQRQLSHRTVAAFRAVRDMSTIQEIAERCIATLIESGKAEDGIVLGGYSFGGNVAFEMACQLIGIHHIHPAGLILMDSFAPQAFAESPRVEQGEMVGDVRRIVASELQRVRDHVEVDDDAVLANFEDTWLANTAALTSYHPRGRINLPISLLRAQQPLRHSYIESIGLDWRQAYNWAEWTTSPVTVIDVPGDHYSIITDPANVAEVAARLDGAVTKLQRGVSRI